MDYLSKNKEELLRHVGDSKQLASITRAVLDDGRERGVRIAEVNNGSGLQFQVLIDRGMDIGKASFKGIPLAWLAPAGFVHPSYYDQENIGWLRTWGAGLVTGCGLRHVGAPDQLDGEEMGLHGRLSHTPAEGCTCTESWEGDRYILSVTGKMRESRVFFENLVLTRKIETVMGENNINITDTIENQSPRPSQVMLLYHINLGYPLLSENSYIKAVEHEVAPRDEVAQPGLADWSKMQPPTAGYKEQCFYHMIPADDDGLSRISLINPDLKLEFEVACRKEELPFVTQWKQMGEGEYVLGLEPANCHVQGINKEKEYGTLKTLQPGESTECLVSMTVKEGAI